MGKHADKLGKIEDFKAPWETDAGEVEIDKDRLKRFIYGLTSDKAKAYDTLEAKDGEIAEITGQRDEFKKKFEAKGENPDLEKELEAERAKTAQEKERADKAERQNLVNEVAAAKGLSPEQAKRLQGATKDELESDADDLLKTFGVEGQAGDGGEDDEDDESLRRTPRRGTNPGDPKSGDSKITKEPDYDTIVAGWKRTTI